MKILKVTSPVFEPNQQIPKKYSCDSQDINPPLTIQDIPQETKTLALVLDDPDAPSGTFTHWTMWNLPSTKNSIDENTAPGIEGLNSMGTRGYTGPCPPPSKPHRYIFKIYALDSALDLDFDSDKSDLEKAMSGHILAEGKLVGLFSRSKP
jgi:Raf kinase inhibitor-like YbhB/YbcL family protein